MGVQEGRTCVWVKGGRRYEEGYVKKNDENWIQVISVLVRLSLPPLHHKILLSQFHPELIVIF